MKRKAVRGKKKRRKKDIKYENIIKKYFTFRVLLIVLIGFLLVLAFSQYIKAIILMAVFIPLAWWTVQFTRFIDYVTIETHTASTILLGFMFGTQFGMISGFILSSIAYLGNGIAKLRGYLDIIFTAMGGYIAGYLALNTDFDFSMVFILATLAKNGISLVLNHLFFDPDKLSNLMYRVTHVFLNVLIYRLFFVAIYKIVMLI